MLLEPYSLLYSMLRIRLVEEALASRYSEQEMRCPMHLCIGQEAIAAGVCSAMSTTDRVFSNHRAHGHYLAKGGNLKSMIAELYGRSTGCCGGRGGSMHLIDTDAGFLGATPIVGGTVPLAVGSAWQSSLSKDSNVTVVFFGDGCFEEGVIHESMNFAALHKLPIVFVCENNDFSVYTHRNERQPNRPIYRIAEAHGLNADSGNGNDIEEVLAMSQSAIVAARTGQGAQFLEFRTYRWREHCGPNFDNDLHYRSLDEIEAGMGDCPIARYIEKARRDGEEIDLIISKIEGEIKMEINESFDFALTSPKPKPDEAGEKLYA